MPIHRYHKDLVSIVIPTYNGERFLATAIESCLRQTYKHIEVIVVDDASPDRCADIAGQYACADERVYIIRNTTNAGVSRAFNTGFGLARGRYLTRLAQDDLFREDAIEVMVRHLAGNPSIDLVYCDAQTIDEAGSVIGIKSAAEPNGALWPDNRIGLCVMWRSSVYEVLGGFNPCFDTAEDYEYWLRISRQYRISKCPHEAPFFFRFHENMGSSRSRAKQECAAKSAQAKHCSNDRLARRFRAEGHFIAGYIHREARAFRASLAHLVIAVWYSPLSRKNYRCVAGLILRLLRLR